MSGVDNRFLKNVGKNIQDLIKQTESFGFSESVVQYLSEYGTFPEDIDKQILEILTTLTDEEYQEVVNDFLAITLSEDKDAINKLLLAIFFPATPPNSKDDSNEYKPEGPSSLPPFLTTNELAMVQERHIFEISDLLDINPEVAEILLKHYQFKKDLLIHEYTKNRTKCLSEIGLNDQQALLPIHFRKKIGASNKTETCPICFDDKKESEFYSLPCGHFFCKECIAYHISTKVNEGQPFILCPMSDCKCQVILNDVFNFCGEKVSKDYFSHILNNDISSEGIIFPCARPNCPNLLTDNAVGLLGVATCTCGYRLCTLCKEAAHAPITCQQLTSWNEIAKEDNQDLKWLKDNTKPCPKCKGRIQKDNGCCYMKCLFCQYEFCWNCGSPFPNHQGHSLDCQNYALKNDVTDTKVANQDVERLQPFLNGYFTQKAAQENEEKVREERKMAILEIFECYDVPAERLDVTKAIELADEVFNAIDEARSLNMFSFPCMFYMKEGSKEVTELEALRNKMAEALEQLSYMAETKQFESPKRFRELTDNLKLCSENLQRFVQDHGSK